MPSISLHNRQRAERYDLEWLRRFAAVALAKCCEHSADGAFALKALPEVEVSIVSDRVIARVHQQFMGIPGATDVITFAHGELVISAQTARENAALYSHTLGQELALYVVHGLLHLNGFEDDTPQAAKRMQKVQERILKQVLGEVPLP